MKLLSRTRIPANSREALSVPMLESLKRFGETEFSGLQMNRAAFETWKQWFAQSKLPQTVQQYCKEFLKVADRDERVSRINQVKLQPYQGKFCEVKPFYQPIEILALEVLKLGESQV